MSLSQRAYCGRFAPSPTGPLHFGSLVCALASFLDARAHNGTWLIRIEDIDPPRDVPGADQAILKTLARLGMTSDVPVVRQSQRYALYEEALRRLIQQGLVYGAHARARKSPQSKPSSDFLLTSTPASAATERTADRLGRFASEPPTKLSVSPIVAAALFPKTWNATSVTS